MIYAADTVGFSPPRALGGAGAGRRADGAFSLIEVMAAVAVMALVLGTAIIAMQIGMRQLSLARTTTAAAQVMQGEAERLRLLNWAALDALPESAELTVPAAFAGEALLNGRVRFTRTISDVDAFANMKEIVLRATWDGGRGREHERVFRLRYTKGGLHDYYYGSTGS